MAEEQPKCPGERPNCSCGRPSVGFMLDMEAGRPKGAQIHLCTGCLETAANAALELGQTCVMVGPEGATIATKKAKNAQWN